MKLRFLNHELEVGGKYITTDLRESNDVLGDVPALRERMAEVGYLLIRGLHERDRVMAARRGIMEDLDRRGFLKPEAPMMEGIVNPGSDRDAIQSAMSNRHLIRLPELLSMVEGDFSNDPIEMVERFGGTWATTEFRAGDAVIFGMHTMHGSTDNSSDRIRISSDTRYQLASEPVDERWVGAEPKGHDEFKGASSTIEPLDVSRARWGV